MSRQFLSALTQINVVCTYTCINNLSYHTYILCMYFSTCSSVAPYNVVVMGNNLYNQGEQLQLNCSSDGGPGLEYTWILSGNIIANANTNTLIIDNVNTTHAGDYTCNVTNIAGNASNTSTVYSKSLHHIRPYRIYCMSLNFGKLLFRSQI